jgi:hypothetical protein
MKVILRQLLAAWIRLQRVGARIGRGRAIERQLSELDAHTLKDIGLETWRSPLGARVETLRRERVRWATSFVGLC